MGQSQQGGRGLKVYVREGSWLTTKLNLGKGKDNGIGQGCDSGHEGLKRW